MTATPRLIEILSECKQSHVYERPTGPFEPRAHALARARLGSRETVKPMASTCRRASVTAPVGGNVRLGAPPTALRGRPRVSLARRRSSHCLPGI
jgi:hypothetical protein